MPIIQDVTKEINKAGTAPLDMKETDPELAESIKTFMNEKNAEPGASPPAPDTPAEPPEMKVNIPPNDDFAQERPLQDIMATEAFVNADQPVNEQEKSLFLKALLLDQPLRLTVTLFRGMLKVEFRSRSHHEQKRIFDLVTLDQKDQLIEVEDVALKVTRFQQYCAILMIERINGELFSEVVLKQGSTLADDAIIMRKAVQEKLEGITMIRWTALFNAMRIFENKCAKLNAEAVNENFWNPPG